MTSSRLISRKFDDTHPDRGGDCNDLLIIFEGAESIRRLPATRDTLEQAILNFCIEQCAPRIRGKSPLWPMTQHHRRIFDIVRKGDVPELARSFPMKTALTGIALGIVFCIALIFSNRAFASDTLTSCPYLIWKQGQFICVDLDSDW